MIIRNIPMKKINNRITKFGLVGIFNTIFDIFIYVVLFNMTNSILIANIIATTVAVIVSYVLNSKFTFNKKHGLLRASRFI